jgi:F-type H+-transporting ATPase subunit epsilon
MVKTGSDVLISVRHAIGGTDLNHLHDEVKRTFLQVDQEERNVRDMVAKMESGFVGRLAGLNHGR